MIRLKKTEEGIEATVSVKVMCRGDADGLKEDLANVGANIKHSLDRCERNIGDSPEVVVDTKGGLRCATPEVTEAADE